jgi:hypothetical protein
MLPTDFTAELHCKYGQVGAADTPALSLTSTAIDQDGWLCTENTRPKNLGFTPITFSFKFIDTIDGKNHYRINAVGTWNFDGAKLERNHNGWVGLYGTHIVGRITDALNPFNHFFSAPHRWEIEVLDDWNGEAASAEGKEFWLRDRWGYRVAQTEVEWSEITGRERTLLYLNASNLDGEILKFHLRNIKVS